MEAISHAGTVLGVLASDGVVLAAEKKVTGKLLDLSVTKEGGYGGSGEKIFLLTKYDCPHRCHEGGGVDRLVWLTRLLRSFSNVVAGVAGLTADANSLINYARTAAQRHLFSFNEDIPVEQLAQRLCDLKQGYTQYGGPSIASPLRLTTRKADFLCLYRSSTIWCLVTLCRLGSLLPVPAISLGSIWKLLWLESDVHRCQQRYCPIASQARIQRGYQGGGRDCTGHEGYE